MASVSSAASTPTSSATSAQTLFGLDDKQSAYQAGLNLTKSEELALKAFTIDSSSSDAKTKIASLATQMGAPKGITLEGLQLFAKRMLEKAQSSYELVSQLFSAKKRAQDVVIGNMGR